MKITWHETKRVKNIKKHGIDFKIAQLVFDDPLQLSEQDRVEGHEYRWQTIGMAQGILIMVGHNYVEGLDEDLIQIITARRATPKERRQYHET